MPGRSQQNCQAAASSARRVIEQGAVTPLPAVACVRRIESHRPVEPTEPGGTPAQGRLFEPFLGLLGQLSEDGPIAIELENLRRADRSTLELVAFWPATLAGSGRR